MNAIGFCRRIRYNVALVITLSIAIFVVVLILQSRRQFIDIVLQIEYRKQDAVPHLLEVTPKGYIYALLETKNGLQSRTYDSTGKLLSLLPVTNPTVDHFDAVIMSSEGLTPTFVSLGKHQPNLRTLRLRMNGDCKVLGKPECVSLEHVDEYFTILPAREAIYMTGSTVVSNSDCPTVIKMDYSGARLWKKVEWSDDVISGPATSDNNNNLILIGSVGAGVGPYMVKYSANGKRLWKKWTEVLDGTGAIWVQTDRQGRIYTIYALHIGIMAESGDDMSGRKQDYVLSMYSPAGKLLRTTKLSHGAWLDVADAAINRKGEIIAVGNRRKMTLLGYPSGNKNAQLIKCDANGRILWSRTLELPSGYLAQRIELDDRKGIYVIGCSRNANDTEMFVYKVMDIE